LPEGVSALTAKGRTRTCLDNVLPQEGSAWVCQVIVLPTLGSSSPGRGRETFHPGSGLPRLGHAMPGVGSSPDWAGSSLDFEGNGLPWPNGLESRHSGGTKRDLGAIYKKQ